MTEERLLYENTKLRADLDEYVQKSNFWYEQYSDAILALREAHRELEALYETNLFVNGNLASPVHRAYDVMLHIERVLEKVK